MDKWIQEDVGNPQTSPSDSRKDLHHASSPLRWFDQFPRLQFVMRLNDSGRIHLLGPFGSLYGRLWTSWNSLRLRRRARISRVEWMNMGQSNLLLGWLATFKVGRNFAATTTLIWDCDDRNASDDVFDIRRNQCWGKPTENRQQERVWVISITAVFCFCFCFYRLLILLFISLLIWLIDCARISLVILQCFGWKEINPSDANQWPGGNSSCVTG